MAIHEYYYFGPDTYRERIARQLSRQDRLPALHRHIVYEFSARLYFDAIKRGLRDPKAIIAHCQTLRRELHQKRFPGIYDVELDLDLTF